MRRVDGGSSALRSAWDDVATTYAALLPDMRAEAPLDLSVLSAFGQLARGAASGPVVEVGCGAGRVMAHLADQDLEMVGIDLSTSMVAAARLAHPTLPLAAGDAAALPFRTGALGGLVSWYSLINTPTAALPEVLDGFARVTAAGAPLLLAFQSGEGERVDRASAYGRRISMTYFLHRAETVRAAVVDAGFSLYATVNREPALRHETTTQSFVLAVRAV